MIFFRLAIFVVILSVVSWLILKAMNKPIGFVWLVLIWLGLFGLVFGSFYGISTLIANSNNMLT